MSLPNLDISPGGSTGGEGALIAAGGSILGLGNDIGGSLRIPAHYCGICSIKPTAGRVSNKGLVGCGPPCLFLSVVNGPMGKTVDDLVAVSKVIYGHNVYRGFQFNSSLYETTRPLRVGVLTSLGFIHPSSSVQRAVREAATLFETAGHELVEFTLPFDPFEAVLTNYAILSCDGGKFFLDALVGEEKIPIMKPFFASLEMHPTIKELILTLLSVLIKDDRSVRIARQFKELSLPDSLILQKKAMEFQAQFNEHWKKSNIDVLLCPPMVLPATPYGSFSEITINAAYAFIWNFLNVPAGIVTVSKVEADDEPYAVDKSYKGWEFRRRDLLEARMAKHFDPKVMAGFPLGVQIVGPQYGDEMVLRAMKDLEDLLKNKQK